MSLRLVVLNLANCDNDPNWPQRKEIIAAELKALQVDAALLQEVRYDPVRCGALDMASELAIELGMQCSLAIAQYYDPISLAPSDQVTAVWEGLGILTRSRPSENAYLNLIKPAVTTDGNHRVSQRIPGPIDLINVHLSTNIDEMKSSLSQTLEWQTADRFLVAGDFNATPDVVAPAMANLVDAWLALHPSEPGYTFPSSAPSERIDYIWISDQLTQRLISVELILAQPVGGLFASDHLGLFIQFQA